MSSAPCSKVLRFTATIPIANEGYQEPYLMTDLYLPLFACHFVISHFNSGLGHFALLFGPRDVSRSLTCTSLPALLPDWVSALLHT